MSEGKVDHDSLPFDERIVARYKYVPTLAAAVLFGVLFSLTTGLHIFQLIRRRTWFFIPFAIGGLCMAMKFSSLLFNNTQLTSYFSPVEVLGYIARAADTKRATLGLYVMQTLLILLGPALYAASIYMILKRLLFVLDAQSYALVKARWLTVFFVGGDVMSFLLQAAGGGVLSSGEDKDQIDAGNNLIIAGLFVQLVVFGFFLVVTIVFHIRIHRRPTGRSAVNTTPWLRHIYVLYVAGILVMIRSIFRAVEYIQGHDGYLISHEVYFYTLDTILMFFLSVLYNVYHPSAVISGRKGSKTPESIDQRYIQMDDRVRDSHASINTEHGQVY